MFLDQKNLQKHKEDGKADEEMAKIYVLLLLLIKPRWAMPISSLLQVLQLDKLTEIEGTVNQS
jgi:hypothetical protein